MRISLCAGLSSPFLFLDLLLPVIVKLHMLCFLKWEFYFCSFPLHFPKIKYFGGKIEYFISICVRKCNVGPTFWPHQD